MNMSMRYFKANNSFSYLLTWEGFLYSQCHFLCKYMHRSQFIIRQIKDIIHFTLRHYQCMSFCQRIDIQKSVKVFILSYLITGNLTSNNFTKYCCHIYEY